MAKFCGNCGKPLGEKERGNHVAVNEAVPPTVQSRTASKAINGKKAAVIGTALLVVIVLAVVLIKAASGTTPKPSTSSISSAPSSSAAQQIAANSSTPDGEPTPIPAAKKETLEERAKKAIKELDVWDGSIAESFDGGDGSGETRKNSTGYKFRNRLCRLLFCFDVRYYAKRYKRVGFWENTGS